MNEKMEKYIETDKKLCYLGIRIDIHLLNRIRQAAKINRRSVSDYTRVVLSDHIKTKCMNIK